MEKLRIIWGKYKWLFCIGIICIIAAAVLFMKRDANNADKILKKSAEQVKTVKSVQEQYKMKASCTLDDSKIDQELKSPKVLFKISADGDVITESSQQHIAGTFRQNIFGEKSNEEINIYDVVEDDIEKEYLYTCGEWTCSRREFREIDITGNLLGLLSDSGTAVVEKETGEQFNKTTTIISGQLSDEALKTYFSNLRILDVIVDEDNVDWTNVVANVRIELYKDSMLPAKVSVSSKSLMNAVMKELFSALGTKMEKSRFSYVCTYNIYNSMDSISLPDEVRAGAISYEDDDLVVEAAEENEEDLNTFDVDDSDYSGDDQIVPNEDGTYTISDRNAENSVKITVPAGMKYAYGDGNSLTLSREDDSYTVKYEILDGMTSSMEESYVRDESWYTEENGYGNIVFSEVCSIEVGEKEISFCSLNYDFEGQGSVRTIYGWDEYVPDCTLLVTMNEVCKDGLEAQISSTDLNELFVNLEYVKDY